MRIRYTKTAQDFMLAQDADTYHSIRGLVVLLATDPSVDGVRKITVSMPPLYVPCYVDDDWWIMYEVRRAVSGEEELIVIAIGPAGTPPAWRR